MGMGNGNGGRCIKGWGSEGLRVRKGTRGKTREMGTIIKGDLDIAEGERGEGRGFKGRGGSVR